MNDYDVAIIPREKFSAVEATLLSLLDQGTPPATVFVFDVGYPPDLRKRIDGYSARFPQLEWVTYDQFQLANACLNDLRQRARSEWVFVIENDCAISRGDLPAILKSAEATGFDVVQPRILEAGGALHYDPPHSYIDSADNVLVHRVVRTPRRGYPMVEGPRRIFHIEKHAFAIRRARLKALGDLEPFLVTRSHWDISFRLFAGDVPILMCPELEVVFTRALACSVDRDYFLWRWQREKVIFANKYLADKWNVRGYKSSLEWFDEMMAHGATDSEG